MSNRPTRRPSDDALAGSEIDLLAFPVEPPTGVPLALDEPPIVLMPPGYEYVRRLGRGGMGVVYLVRNIESKRTEALKIMLTGSERPLEEYKRFRQETEAVARLHHPNIVQLYSCGTHAGMPFYTLEYCPGGSLASLISEANLPYHNAARLVEQLAQGMFYAHSRNIVHRDLKPSNILLDENGTPKIADFGLAKLTDSLKSGLTASEAAVGTPDYMSPEQASGQSRSVGPAADIWALGAILYRLLTGRPPFVGINALLVLSQVVTAEPPKPRTIDRSIPRDLETICLKCLQKDPTKRYASAEALAADLRAFQESRPIQARRVGTVERLWRWGRRNPVLAVLSLTLALLLPVATVVSTYLAIWALGEAERADRQTQEALASQWKAVEAAETATHAEQNAREQSRLLMLERAELDRQLRRSERLFYRSQLTLAQHYWSSDRVSEARQALALAQPSLRGWEYDYLEYMLNLQGQRSLIKHTAAINRVAISGDGKRAVTASQDKTLRVWDTQTGECLSVLHGHKHPVHFVAMTADGQWIVSSDYPADFKREPSTIILWNGQTGREVRRFSGHSLLCRGPSISDDGKLIVAAASYSKLTFWEAQTGKLLRECDAGPQLLISAALSADGKTAVSGSKDGVLRIWDADTGTVRHTLKVSKYDLYSVALSADGRLVATGTVGFLPSMREVTGEVKLWDTASGQELIQLPGQDGSVYSLALSRDGKALVSSDCQVVRYWDVPGKRLVTTFRGHTQTITGVAISSNGQHIVSSGQEPIAKVWTIDTQQQNRSINSLYAASVVQIPVSPDSQRIALKSWKHELLIYDLSTLQPLQKIQAPPGELMRAVFVPGRPWLVGRLAMASGEQRAQPLTRQHGQLLIWNYETGERLAEYDDLPVGLGALAVLPEQQTLLCGHAGPNNTGIIELRDLDTGKIRRTLTGHNQPVHSLVVSGDGRLLLSASAEQAIPQGKSHPACEVRLWDLRAGVCRHQLNGHESRVVRVAMSEDGQVLVSAESDGKIILWDAATGQPKRTFVQQRGIRNIALNRDGGRLFSVGLDRTLRVWDTQTGIETMIQQFPAFLDSVTLTPDERRLLISDIQGKVTILETGPP